MDETITTEEKNRLIVEYIYNKKKELERMDVSVSDEKVKEFTNKYINSPLSLKEIKEEIDELVREKLKQLRKLKELMEKEQNLEKNISNLTVETKGITLNMQQIDLLSIVTANETNLNQVLENIHNISDAKKQLIVSNNESIKEIKKSLFDTYQDSLTSYEETNFTPDGRQKERAKKINFMLNNCNLSDEEQQQVLDMIKNNPLNDIPKLINETFDKETSNRIFQTFSSYMPTEMEGIKDTSYEAFERLADHLKDYQLINLDSVAKYSHYVRSDGSFNHDDLIKAFDFARSHGMQTRLNTLLFYMDTPKELENKSVEEGKEQAKELLRNYVKDITSVIAEYNKNCIESGEKPTVRTVEIFNELLNRFAMEGEAPYEYRGSIDTDQHRISIDDPNYDDLRAGWLRFLTIDELCEIMKTARENLPDVNFMINEYNLEDPQKIETFKRLIIEKIQKYEEEHNTKLIDSIGTQMHISSSISKDDIKKMFENLSTLGLPIEVTEFDMAIDQEFINSHTEEEIEDFKKQKLNEFFDVVEEMQEKVKITGVTIWSVSDIQNFVVQKENEKIYKENIERQKAGLEPIPYIKTLYGGYYNKNMEDITKTKFDQEFNYHTHTYRSGHSEYASDEEILEAAKQAGISMIGFSEHVPNSNLELPDEDHRMMLSEVDGYIESINKMKQNNPDMTILAGFEAEFDPMKESFLGEMKEKVDYMILGQHFVKNGMQMIPQKGNPNYPLEYAEIVCKGMESGIFDIVAHPDCFMEFRDTISDENKELYEENCIKASHMICQKAEDLGIPLEINMGDALNIEKQPPLKDGNLGKPHPLFWNVAKDYDVKVLKGIDTHFLQTFKDLDKGQVRINNIEDIVHDKMIKEPYNPVVERQKNEKLQEVYERHKEEALTYETHMISQITNFALRNVEDNQDQKNLITTLGTSLNDANQACIQRANEKGESILDEISQITNSKELSGKDKVEKLKRKETAAHETKSNLENQQNALKNAKESIVTATDAIGCQTKNEYANILPQIIEHSTTSSEAKKRLIEANVLNFQKSKKEIGGSNSNSKSNEKPKVLTKANHPIGIETSDHSSNNTNNGFANTIMLTVIVTFAVGIIVGLLYMISQFGIK